MASPRGVPYLNQIQAQSLDEELMQCPGFTLDQLMELAGQAVAVGAAKSYPLEQHPKVAIICGPGNNGGDGLVAARHLWHYGYTVEVYYPAFSFKYDFKPKHHHYQNLVRQLQDLDIVIRDDSFVMDSNHAKKIDDQKYDFFIDALLGFSNKGAPRAPYAAWIDY